MPHRILARVGLRSKGLILIGILWLLFGLSVAVGASSPRSDSLWHLVIDYRLRAAGWVATGALALASSRWHRLSNLALALATVMPMIRLTSYIGAWIVALIPGPPPGNPTGWLSSLYFVAVLALVLYVAQHPADEPRNREALAWLESWAARQSDDKGAGR
ncbi:hypothetical protein ACSDQ9_05735 [Aestuariimicrobium soli]|uniref:hypothetical protein n=1 Tax=Aestuariimicrobium soli TaxID=2035834 RepID=UPI003EB8778A